MTTFTAQIEDFVRETDDRMLRVVRSALDNMVMDMQQPVSKGGKMRVDTGFLRASGRASLDGWPSGNGVRPANAPVGQYTGIYDNFDGKAVQAVLLDMKLGDTFYFGWIATYARYREARDGFMDAPLQNWQGYINTATEKLRGKVK